jgi:hypothetical protein
VPYTEVMPHSRFCGCGEPRCLDALPAMCQWTSEIRLDICRGSDPAARLRTCTDGHGADRADPGTSMLSDEPWHRVWSGRGRRDLRPDAGDARMPDVSPCARVPAAGVVSDLANKPFFRQLMTIQANSAQIMNLRSVCRIETLLYDCHTDGAGALFRVMTNLGAARAARWHDVVGGSITTTM